MYDARQIANEFIRRGLDDGRALTPMHVQKLVFFSHARFLAFHKTPLIKQTFEAWEHGPVIRDVYDALKSYGAKPVTEPIFLRDQVAEPIEDHGAIDWCFRTYGHVGALTLSDLTHSPDGPWARTQKNAVISNDMIREYYAEPWIEENKALLSKVMSHPQIIAEYEQSVRDFAEGRYYAASSPEEMMEQIRQRREERGEGGS